VVIISKNKNKRYEVMEAISCLIFPFNSQIKFTSFPYKNIREKIPKGQQKNNIFIGSPINIKKA